VVQRDREVLNVMVVVDAAEVKLVVPKEGKILAVDGPVVSDVQVVQVNIKVTLHYIIKRFYIIDNEH